MRFQVPQFIETEEKIIGPFTLKQFFWVLGAVTVIFVSFLGFGAVGLILGGMPIAVLLISLGFIPIGGIVMSTYIFHAFKYFIKPKKYYYKDPSGESDAIDQNIN